MTGRYYGISRQVFCTWYLRDLRPGGAERAIQVASAVPHETPSEVVAKIIQLRSSHPFGWCGARGSRRGTHPAAAMSADKPGFTLKGPGINCGIRAEASQQAALVV